jgi:FKBP-type peptidyl-prolyl cis-trans isomerase
MKKKYILPVAIVIILLLGGYFLLFGGSSGQKYENVEILDGNLITYEVKVGEGREVKTGDTVSVHYIGALTDETVFDSSHNRGEPFSFTIGEGQVIQGWERGLIGMKAGGVRRLAIPPHLAYGAGGVPGAIPPNSTLIFEIELLEIKQ